MEDLGPDGWNPVGIKILGTPVWNLEFLSTFVEQRLVEEQKIVGRHPLGAGRAMRMAGPPPVRWAALPPPSADSAPQSVIEVRARA